MAVNAAGNYTKPTRLKRLFNRIKAGGKGGDQDNGLHVKLKCLLNNIKHVAEDISNAFKSRSEKFKKMG